MSISLLRERDSKSYCGNLKYLETVIVDLAISADEVSQVMGILYSSEVVRRILVDLDGIGEEVAVGGSAVTPCKGDD